MSSAGQLFLRWSMNRARLRAGLPALRTSTELMAIAQRRSREIVTIAGGIPSHQGAGAPSWYWGEILGWNSGILGQAAAGHIVSLWLTSPRHRAVLLGRWTHIGAGVTVAGGRTWFAGVFGHR